MKNILDSLRKAKEAFESGRYEQSEALYADIIETYPEMKSRLAFNYSLVKKRIGNVREDMTDADGLPLRKLRPKVVVYTCNVGGYEPVKEPLYVDPNVDYILFTDDTRLTSKFWKVVVLKETLDSPRRLSRLPKILAHEFLPPHDISIYIDSSLEIKCKNIHDMAEECLSGKDMALYRHAERVCVYDEIDYVVNSKDRALVDPLLADRILEKYRSISYPKKRGLYENALIVRRNAARVRKVNEDWWKEFLLGAERDQFTLMYALEINSLEVAQIERGTQFRDSPYVNFYPHRYQQLGWADREGRARKRFAVCVHIYYADMWDKIKSYLENIGFEYDLYVTVTKNIAGAEEVELDVRSYDHNAVVLRVENLGMDVLPFLSLVYMYSLHNYCAVLKVHTKNRSSEKGRLIGDVLLDSCLGSRALLGDIYDAFLNHGADSVVPDYMCRSGEFTMYGNRDLFVELSEILDCQYRTDSKWLFVAGTMLWMRGCHLAPLFDNYRALLEVFYRDEYIGKGLTGGDATPAHAMERIFGFLVTKENQRVYRSLKAGIGFQFTLCSQGAFLGNKLPRIFRLGSGDIVSRYKDVDVWAALLKQSGRLDVEFYKGQIQLPIGMDPYVHYVLYGDVCDIDPNRQFSVTYYKLRYSDVPRNNIPCIVHFITNGSKEGRVGQPSQEDWIRLKSINHRLVSRSVDNIKNNFLEELVWEDIVRRCFHNRDYVMLLAVAKECCDKFGNSLFFSNALATGYLMNGEFERAYKEFAQHWPELESASREQRKVLINYDRKNPDVSRSQFIQYARKISRRVRKVCIYTSLFGDIDELPPVISESNDIDFICFTDRERTASGWRFIVKDRRFDSDNLNAKIYKILPQLFLQEYEFSLFVDANTLLYGRLHDLINNYLIHEDFAMFPHPHRDDLYEEVAAIISHCRHSPEDIVFQAKEYFDRGMPVKCGMYEGSFIWRNHSSPDVCNSMQEWWSHITAFSKRDQISLAYICEKNKFRPSVLPSVLGSSRDNIYFNKLSHNRDSISGSFLGVDKLSFNQIVFVFSDDFENSGSTIMRGRQLSEVIRANNVTNMDVRYSNSRTYKNSILFLTKGFLNGCSAEHLAWLKRNGNLLLADFVDAIPDAKLVDQVDVLIASSISAYKYYVSRWPGKLSHLVTHHADPRLEALENTRKSLKIGYFGELVNTISTPAIDKLVDFNLVSTNQIGCEGWLSSISRYECHYAVRKTRNIDGFKPFTKGFTAARCNANVIVQEDADDVKYYLGSDYPYMLPSNPTEKMILEVIEKVNETYLGAEWQYGKDIMRSVYERSSLKHISSEFFSLLKML